MNPIDIVAPEMSIVEESALTMHGISEEDILAAAQQLKQERDDKLNKLATKIEKLFDSDATKRRVKEDQWIEAERLILGSAAKSYSYFGTNDRPLSGQSQSINNRPPQFNIVRPKLRIAKAQLEMMQFGAGTDKNFEIIPTTNCECLKHQNNDMVVEHPDGGSVTDPATGQPLTYGEIAQQTLAKDYEAARLMDQEVWSQCVEADYGNKIRDGFDDMLLYGTVIYQGPFNNVATKKDRKQLTTSDGKSVWISVVNDRVKPDFKIVNPWMFFPDHRALSIKECEHATVVNILTAKDMRNLSKREGFFKDVIGELLKSPQTECYYENFRARASLYDNKDYTTGKYVALEFHGTFGKTELDEIGVEPPFDNPFDVYQGEVWVCNGKVIYVGLELLESCEDLPFATSTWVEDPASLFGYGAILLFDCQRVVDKTYKMVLDNAGLSALPQIGINQEIIKSQDGKNELAPGKAWIITEYGKTIADAIQFLVVPSNIDDLTKVLNMAREFGNEESIIPLIQGGLVDPSLSDASATNMSIVQKASTSVLSNKTREWDDFITKKIICWFYEWNMQYSDKEEIKGNFQIDVKTSTAYLNKAMQLKDIERLCLEITQNPELQDLIDPDQLYRARLSQMNLPHDRIVRDKDTVEKLRKAKAEAMKEQQQNNPDMLDAQSKLITAQARQQEVAVKQQQLEFDASQGMQQAQMSHQEHMANYTITRPEEARARMYEVDKQLEIEKLKMQSEQETHAAKIAANMHIQENKIKSHSLQSGMKQVNQQQNIALKKKELQLKAIEALKPKSNNQ